MPWSVVILPEAHADLEALAAADLRLPDRLRAEILQAFLDEFKALRLEAAIRGHARTSQIDRLEGSAFPLSFRLHILHDFRATVWCLPAVRQAVVAHVFAKSSDPAYRRAISEHDGRLEVYFMRFKDFAEGAERRRKRRGGVP